MLYEDADFGVKFGPTFCRFVPKNADGGLAGPTRVVSSSAGPFDFSDAAVPAAVTVTIKTDNGAVVNETLDLSAVGNIAAVTVAELATAWTAASVTGYTGTTEAGTGYFKVAKTTPGTSKYMQVGGELALYTGMPLAIIPVNTMISIAIEQVNKDGEVIEVVDARGKTTSKNTDTVPTGANITVTDSTFDPAIKALVEGGTWEVVAGFTNPQYNSAGQDSIPNEFVFETFNERFAAGANKQNNIKDYVWRIYRAVKGSMGGEAGDNAGQAQVANLSAVPYRDPLTGLKEDRIYSEIILTTTEFAALHVEEV